MPAYAWNGALSKKRHTEDPLTPTYSSSEKDIAILAQGLTKTYRGDVRALDGLDIEVREGTCFGLLGPNGAGKSTTVKIMTTLTTPDGGVARVVGIDVRQNPDKVRRSIGSVAQKTAVDLTATGRENLMLQGKVYGMRGQELKLRVAELLEQFGLASDADRLVRGYSGGMQRRLDVALGIIHRPRVLFMDEPTVGLDPEMRVSLWDQISELVKAEGLTLLFTTHYLDEADLHAEKLAIIDAGKVVARGTPDALKSEMRGDGLLLELADPGIEARVCDALRALPGISDVTVQDHELRARAEKGSVAVPIVLSALEAAGITVASVTVSRPSLDDVYLLYAGREFTKADIAGAASEEKKPARQKPRKEGEKP